MNLQVALLGPPSCVLVFACFAAGRGPRPSEAFWSLFGGRWAFRGLLGRVWSLWGGWASRVLLGPPEDQSLFGACPMELYTTLHFLTQVCWQAKRLK